MGDVVNDQPIGRVHIDARQAVRGHSVYVEIKTSHTRSVMWRLRFACMLIRIARRIAPMQVYIVSRGERPPMFDLKSVEA